MRRPALKSPRAVADPVARGCIADLNECIEQLRGARGKKIEPLDPATATTAQLAEKINAILELLQG